MEGREIAVTEAIQGRRAPERISIGDLNASGPFPAGAPNTVCARYFTGKSRLGAISTSQVPLFVASFKPGCRGGWHVQGASRGGGKLLAAAGRGRCQVWGEEPVELHPGDAVHIPANARHWHGAAPDTGFQHLALEVPGEDAGTAWLEPVSDAGCARLA